MNKQLIDQLRKVNIEEQAILDGSKTIDTALYSTEESKSKGQLIEAKMLLDEGRLIQVRKHPRFIHFPRHRHDYVEMMYMCSGSTKHRINGKDIVIKEGEVLLLGQNTYHEIFKAGEDDIAVNFIIVPKFFDYSLRMMEQEQNPLRQFIVDSLTGNHINSGYMHFMVADVLPIQNLIENLIWTIANKQPNKRSINQATMGLLLLQLMNHMDKLNTDLETKESRLVVQVLQYIEEHYKDDSLTDLAKQMHYDIGWLSREIKKQTGHTYTELLQKKRINQAAFLLTHTSMSVLEVGVAVGYENQSYFHKIFRAEYGETPRKYRLNQHIVHKL